MRRELLYLIVILLGAACLRGTANAQTESQLAGVYAARRTVTNSTCPSTTPGDVSASIWIIEYRGSSGYGMNALGTTAFRTFRGQTQDGTLILTASGEGAARLATMTLSLRGAPGGELRGTETVSAHEQGRACSVVRAVTVRPLHAS